MSIQKIFSYKAALGLLIISGLVINSYFSLTLSLWHDEAITANAAISFLQNGIPNFQSGYEYWRSFPHTLAVALSGHIFGVTDFSLRLPSILAGTLTLGLTYLVGKKFFNKKTGLIATAFLTFSAWQVAWASQVRMYAMFQFLYLTSIYLIYLAVEKEDKKYFIGLLVTIFVTIRAQVTGQILPFVAVFYWVYRNQGSELYRKLSLPILVLVAIFVLELSSIESFLSVLTRFEFNPENIYFYYELGFKQIPVLSLLGVSGSLIALKKNLNTGILMSAAVFPALFIYLLYVDGVSLRYIYFSAPFLAVWSSLTVQSISENILEFLTAHTNFKISLRQITASLVLLCLIIGSGFNFGYSDNNYRLENNERSVYSYIDSHGSLNDTLITQWTPPATYYLKSPDYSLYSDQKTASGYNSSYYRNEYEFKQRELYSGAEFIDSNEKLVEIINKNENGWIVLRADSYRKKTSDVKQTISSLEPISEFTENNITYGNKLKVWKWNSSTKLPD